LWEEHNPLLPLEQTETVAEEAQPQPGEVILEDELEVIDTIEGPLGLDVNTCRISIFAKP